MCSSDLRNTLEISRFAEKDLPLPGVPRISPLGFFNSFLSTMTLHFSVPDEGPLTDYESWMPDFVGGLAKGIENSRGLVEKAVRDVASDMVISPKVGAAELASMEGGYGGMGNMADFLAGIRSAVSEAMAGFAGQAGDIIIPVYVGGTLLDEVIVGAQARQSLRSGGR